LSAWGSWSEWLDQTSCGPSYRRYIIQKRTRRRYCDDSTKNIHGRSCAADKLKDEATKKLYVCEKLKRVFIAVYNKVHGGTSGKLWMTIKQGTNSCTTSKPTWDAPQIPPRSSSDLMFYPRNPNGCTKTFDTREDVIIRLHSDSKDDVYIKYMGALTANSCKWWTYTGPKNDGKFLKIDKNSGNCCHRATESWKCDRQYRFVFD
jgi:hypothetical protein